MTKPIATALPPGIHRRADGGYRVVACTARDKRREKRYPAGTPVRDMAKWQRDTCTALDAGDDARPAGSLIAELETDYLPLKAAMGMPTLKAREADLRRMIAILGPTRRRDEIDALDVKKMLARLRIAGRAARTRQGATGAAVKAGGRVVTVLSGGTLNRYKNALQNFFTELGGRRGHNPVIDVPDFDEDSEAAEPPAISIQLFDQLLDAMPDLGKIEKGRERSAVSLTKLRLTVIAFTGLPQSQIGKLTPDAIDWAGNRVAIAGRRKGKGTSRKWMPMSDHGMDALRAFADADAFGRFSPSSMWQSFRRAVAKVAPGTAISPYSLRHLFGTVTLDASEDLDATRRLMDHGSKSTTRIYTRAAITQINRRANALFDRAVEAGRAGGKSGNVVAIGCGTRAAGGHKNRVSA